MTDLLDTSLVVRYLTLDPPDLGELARAVIEGDDPLALLPVALAEAGYVLTSVYGIPRSGGRSPG